MLSPILICRRRRRAGEISKAYFASAQCSDSSCGDMLATSAISPLSPMKSASRGKATSSIHKQNQRGDSNISSIPPFFFKVGRCDRPRFPRRRCRRHFGFNVAAVDLQSYFRQRGQILRAVNFQSEARRGVLCFRRFVRRACGRRQESAKHHRPSDLRQARLLPMGFRPPPEWKKI